MKTVTPLLVILCLASLGCRREFPVAVVEFEPNRVLAYNIGQNAEISMEPALEQSTRALADAFGTPDEPKLPDYVLEDPDFGEMLSQDHLAAASGPADMEGRGLFRKHCAICHGVTGNGRGTTAALINPYPRDFRMGQFKFKSTTRGGKPLKEDLAYVIRNGIPGTGMVKIQGLSDQDIKALTDYVIYLSWRGEVERKLLVEAEFFAFDEGESLYDPTLAEEPDERDIGQYIANAKEEAKENEEEPAPDDELKAEYLELRAEMWDEQQGILEDFVFEVAESWLGAEERFFELPERDESIVPASFDALRSATASDADSPVKASVLRGKELFLSDAAACAKCHGKEGRGDGQTNDYDDWTKDWTKNFNVSPTDEQSHIPLIARGALPVRKVAPRNFESGLFHGGNTPEKLYRRIAQGIDGTPMPAATLKPEQIWDLVNFVRSMSKKSEEADSVEANKEAVL